MCNLEQDNLLTQSYRPRILFNYRKSSYNRTGEILNLHFFFYISSDAIELLNVCIV